MGKASRTKVDSSRREKIAAQRAAARRAEQRRRILIASGSVVAVLAIVLAFVVIKLNSKSPSGPSSASNGPTGSALAAVIDQTTSVPGEHPGRGRGRQGAFAGQIHTISGNPTPLTENGKPEMFYIGRRVLPVLRGQRWAMIVALSRFGTFSGLHDRPLVQRPTSDPNTPSWTFLQVHLHQQVPDLHAGRAADQHPRPSTTRPTPTSRRPPPPSRR